MVTLLKVRGLVKSYGRRRVVDGVDFEVHPGEIVGLLGPNGAGKTTTFRMACGMIDPDAGSVILAGQDVTRWPMYRRAKDGGMGYLAQESSVFRKLSVQKNLIGVMELLGMSRKVRNRRAVMACHAGIAQNGCPGFTRRPSSGTWRLSPPADMTDVAFGQHHLSARPIIAMRPGSSGNAARPLGPLWEPT
jgi:ABC-type Fe3+/spermidine/putrescine transport system ATPase subunit